MTSPFEFGAKKSFYNGNNLLVGYKPSRNCANVRVVVCSCQCCNFRYPAQCRPDVLVLVGGYTDPLAAATKGYPKFKYPLVDGVSDRMGKVGVIATFAGKAAKVFVGDP